jgi:hypothetical protein
VDEAAAVDDDELTTTKTPVTGLTVMIGFWKLADENVREVHVIPSVDEAAVDEAAATAAKTPVVELTVTEFQPVFTVGKVRWVHVIPSVDEAAIVWL